MALYKGFTWLRNTLGRIETQQCSVNFGWSSETARPIILKNCINVVNIVDFYYLPLK